METKQEDVQTILNIAEKAGVDITQEQAKAMVEFLLPEKQTISASQAGAQLRKILQAFIAQGVVKGEIH